MMPEEQGGVVNNRLLVHGVDQLRIVDASIFPLIVDGHPQASRRASTDVLGIHIDKLVIVYRAPSTWLQKKQQT